LTHKSLDVDGLLAETLPVVVSIEAQQVCGNRPAEEAHESAQLNGSLDAETVCE
jgi:hypothetical protein